MRHIQKRVVQLRLPADWDATVKAAKKDVLTKVRSASKAAMLQGKTKDQVASLVCQTAHNAIDASAKVWSKAKTALAAASFDKCWYCECKQDRSDLHVDHFRPKNKVANDRTHPGYWWLAFDWENFRLACTYCNCARRDSETGDSGGKATKFPIIEPPARMRKPHDQRDKPMLLDPLVISDPSKLTYHINGLARSVNSDATTEDWKRVNESILVFHFRETRLKRAREDLAIDIENEFVAANTFFENGDTRNFERLADKLLARIRADAPYSMFARFALSCHRDKVWVNDLWIHL